MAHEPTFPGRGEVSLWYLALLYLVRGAIEALRQASKDRLAHQAMALSFQSLFSTIPVVVIGLTLMTQFISQQEVSEIADWLSLHMLPAQAQQIAPEIRHIADSVDVSALGLAGVLGLFLVAATLFWTLTHIVDDIWGISKKPPLAYRALSAVVILLLLPTFTAASVIVTQLLAQLPGSFDFFIPLTITVTGLWLVYRYVPSARVDWRAALVSAVLMGVILELGKIFYSFYVVRLSVTVRGIYGAIAFIPLSLFWLYLLWLIFLIGVELTYTFQNLPELWMQRASNGDGAVEDTAGGPLALLAAYGVYRSGSATVTELSRQIGASPQAVRAVLKRLVEGGFVVRANSGPATPSRPAREIAVVDILSLFATSRTHDGDHQGEERLEKLLERLETSRDHEISGLTLADLLK